MEYVLRTKELTKRYNNSKVLNGITMNVPKGSIYGIVGKNGAGKTTLMRIICGIQKQTTGEYEIYGVCSENKDIIKSRKRMGAVVEQPSIFLDMTAEENIKYQADLIGVPSYNFIKDLLKVVGIDILDKNKVKNFSLGMRQRLGIAVALTGNPDFLVLDEPMNGLDPQGIVDIRELILKLNRQYGITILISSHILNELFQIATHYGIINNGVIVKELSADELKKQLRKSVEIKVTDINALIKVLDMFKMEYTISKDMTVNLFSEIDISKLVIELNKENCKVINMKDRQESFESYYLNLVGG